MEFTLLICLLVLPTRRWAMDTDRVRNERLASFKKVWRGEGGEVGEGIYTEVDEQQKSGSQVSGMISD